MKGLAGWVAVLVAGFALFYDASRTPAPLPADAPPSVFSAGRAMADIAVLAQAPHPIGSPTHDAVRDGLLARMTALGLSPQLQPARSRYSVNREGESYIDGGAIENVIGVLPGRDRAAPALALMAHYDSVAGSPGAADDMAGTASVLEIVRALKAHGTPARDVIVLITDGEEAGLLGAQAFFSDNPLARHVGFVLNLEARGGGGRAAMFQTGDRNGAAIDLYSRVTRQPNANALAQFHYQRLPNDTDYTIAKRSGVPGLNYAFIGREFDYHSPSSTVAALDQGSVQNMGGQALDAARALAFAPQLPPPAPDATYASLLGRVTLAYAPWGGWLLLAAIGGLLVLAALGARRREGLVWGDVACGAGLTLLILTGGALALHLTRHVTGFGFGWMPGRALLARFWPFELAMVLSALGALVGLAVAAARGQARWPTAGLALAAGLAASALGGFDPLALGEGVAAAALAALLLGRPLRLAGAWLGLLLVALLAAAILQQAAPTIDLILAWPLAVAALSAALLAGGTDPSPLKRWLVLALSALAVAWIGDLAHSVMQAMDVPELPVLELWLAALVLWPLVWPVAETGRAAYVPPAMLLVLGLALAAGLGLTKPWSPRHPSAAEPLYLVDRDQGRAFRISRFAPDAWSRGVLTADGGAIARRAVATFSQPAWAAPATLVASDPPDIQISHSPDGLVTLSAAPGARERLTIDVKINTAVRDARVDGWAIANLAKPGRWIHLRWQGGDGLAFSFRPEGPGAIEAAYAVYTAGWPARARPLPPRPADVMAWDLAGSTVVTGRLRAGW